MCRIKCKRFGCSLWLIAEVKWPKNWGIKGCFIECSLKFQDCNLTCKSQKDTCWLIDRSQDDGGDLIDDLELVAMKNSDLESCNFIARCYRNIPSERVNYGRPTFESQTNAEYKVANFLYGQAGKNGIVAIWEWDIKESDDSIVDLNFGCNCIWINSQNLLGDILKHIVDMGHLAINRKKLLTEGPNG